MKVTITLTPEEFREILTPELKEFYDKIVDSLIRYGVDEKIAKTFVARELNRSISRIAKERKV